MTFTAGTGLDCIKDNASVIARIGTTDDYVPVTAPVSAGSSVFQSATAFNVGDCVVVLSKDFGHIDGKSKRGYLRRDGPHRVRPVYLHRGQGVAASDVHVCGRTRHRSPRRSR